VLPTWLEERRSCRKDGYFRREPGGTKTTAISDPSGISANQTTVFDSETIRGRFGYAADNVLFYATGGFAWSNVQYVRTQLTGALNNATAGADEAVNKGLAGWTAGGGVAYAFAQNWNVFAEYRYASFGSSNFSLPFSRLTTTSTTTVSTVELGVNYKFTPGGQVGAAPFVNQGGRATGWTAGVGVDYAITESVFARIEYRYTNLTTSGFVSAATNTADAPNRVPINDLRAGIAYKFGIPVAANL
jgi:opacity protein-like surface antigen